MEISPKDFFKKELEKIEKDTRKDSTLRGDDLKRMIYLNSVRKFIEESPRLTNEYKKLVAKFLHSFSFNYAVDKTINASLFEKVNKLINKLEQKPEGHVPRRPTDDEGWVDKTDDYNSGAASGGGSIKQRQEKQQKQRKQRQEKQRNESDLDDKLSKAMQELQRKQGHENNGLDDFP